jgi:hypothetical protein
MTQRKLPLPLCTQVKHYVFSTPTQPERKRKQEKNEGTLRDCELLRLGVIVTKRKNKKLAENLFAEVKVKQNDNPQREGNSQKEERAEGTDVKRRRKNDRFLQLTRGPSPCFIHSVIRASSLAFAFQQESITTVLIDGTLRKVGQRNLMERTTNFQ